MNNVQIIQVAVGLLLTFTGSISSYANNGAYRLCVTQCQSEEEVCKNGCSYRNDVVDGECFDQCEAKGEACVFMTCRKNLTPMLTTLFKNLY